MKEYDEDEALERCGCGNPGARPPCSYCENSSMYDDDEYEDAFEDDDWRPTKSNVVKTPTVEETLRKKVNDLVLRVQELEDAGIEKLRTLVYVEVAEEMEAYARSEVYADLESSMYDEVYKKEYGKIREKVEAQARADIEAEVRKQIMKEITEANERI